MKTVIVNCTLPYLFEQADVELLNANGKVNTFTRLLNKFKKVPVIPESLEAYDSVKTADIVILFGSTSRFVDRCEHIEQITGDRAYLHLYLWNPKQFYIDDPGKLSDKWRVWSFSKKDAETFGIGYAETFYNRNLVENAVPVTDMFFVGLDKGRMHQIITLRELANQQKLVADINVVDEIKRHFSQKYVGRMSCSEVRKRISRTRAVVDITQENQQGMTQRVMEAIFFKKKLITNNQFVQTCPFYTPSNVFIIGVDNPLELRNFIRAPYEEQLDFNVNMYDVKNWLRRIVNNEEFHG